MTQNTQPDDQTKAGSRDNLSEARPPHSIRFSDSEWDVIEDAAARRGFSSGKLVRFGALAAAEAPLGEPGRHETSPGHAALIEDIYRAVYILGCTIDSV